MLGRPSIGQSLLILRLSGVNTNLVYSGFLPPVVGSRRDGLEILHRMGRHGEVNFLFFSPQSFHADPPYIRTLSASTRPASYSLCQAAEFLDDELRIDSDLPPKRGVIRPTHHLHTSASPVFTSRVDKLQVFPGSAACMQRRITPWPRSSV